MRLMTRAVKVALTILAMLPFILSTSRVQASQIRDSLVVKSAVHKRPNVADDSSLPFEIESAFTDTHDEAASSGVRNLFMFNYTYFAGGFCKDQDCSVSNVQTQIQAAKIKMGDDFEKYNRLLDDYSKAIAYLQRKLPAGDLGTLNGLRTYRQIAQAGIFVSCVDFAKSVMGKAIENGFSEDDLKIFVTMDKEGYAIMCPAADGRDATFPRPTIHTLIAYRKMGNWFALNVENPQASALFIGPNLPLRLSREFQFTFPALVAYRKLIYAGSYSPSLFIHGYQYSWLLGIAANGKLESVPNRIRCE